MHVSHHQGWKTCQKWMVKLFFSGAWNSLIWQTTEHPYFTTDLTPLALSPSENAKHIFDQFHYVLSADSHIFWLTVFFIITNYACELTIIKFDTVAVSLLIYFHQNENCHYENPSTFIKKYFRNDKMGVGWANGWSCTLACFLVFFWFNSQLIYVVIIMITSNTSAVGWLSFREKTAKPVVCYRDFQF